MNFYILINYRKIRSKDNTKDNFLKLAFKDVGTNGEKKYKSKIIVNDIKMDYSINLIPKSNNPKTVIPKTANPKTMIPKPMNTKPMNSTKNVKEISKQKPVKIIEKKDKDKQYNRNKSFDNTAIEKKKSADVPKSKLPLFKRTVRAVTMVNKMNKENQVRSVSSTTRTVKSKTIYRPPPKVKEKHINEKKDIEDIISQKIPYLKKKSSSKNNNTKDESKDKLKPKHNSYIPEKNKVLSQMISEDTRPQKKLKTIKTEEIFLEPIKYEKYLSDNNSKNNKAKQRETFCEGFFISSFPQKDGQVVEKSQSFPAPCGHKECSALPAMKPEIILRHPLKDTKTLELNNLAATICFPTGIKVCYTENEPEMVKDYVTPITNQKGERYYMMTYHFYLKMDNDIYSKNYEMHPLKHHLMKFADNYLNMSEDEMNEEITEQIQTDLEQAQNLGFRDNIFIPYCICLISKYPYVTEMKKCLQSIYCLINHQNPNLNDPKEKSKINYLIMHIINSIPIPDIESRVHFYIPYFSQGIELKCPKLNDLKVMNSTISNLLNLFSIDYIVIIFRFLIFEKKILFIDEDYTRLSNVTDSFISLLYPFQWMHTYIPIMSDQMLKYLETFLPFLNGIHLTLMPLVSELFQTGDMEESDEMFLIYINISKFRLGSTLIGKNIKKYKYVEENVPALPYYLEKELKAKLKKIKEEIDSYQKKNPNNKDLSEFDLKIRNAFIEMFVKMFHDIDKYLCFLDDDVVFNKNLFMETISKDDKRFYDEFIDTQLFQLFSQNIVNNESNYYFKTMINEYNKNNKFSNDDKKEEEVINYIKKIYILNPDYLGIKEKNKKNIETKINEKYNLKEEKDQDGFILNNKRITEYMQNIDNNNYNNKNCNIYLIPEKIEKGDKKKALNLLTDILIKKNSKESAMNPFKKFMRIKANKNEISEKEKEEIKEKIKDFTVKIFKSEEIEDDIHMKKDLQNNINTNFGREFFVNLLSKNTTNVILLKENSFKLLWSLIYNTLLDILQVEENNKILEQIVILIKSTMFFGKEEKEIVGYILTEEKKNTVTLWSTYKQKLQTYNKINQYNLWSKWYDINLNAEKEKDSEEVKKKVILQLCDLMIELELVKSFIKNTLKKLVERVFGKNEEKNKTIMQDIIQKIIKTKYISKADKNNNI